ncbi:MAG TPA: winged helix-turn-helix domain-containing protein [Ktedonobacteraceae bacterium]
MTVRDIPGKWTPTIEIDSGLAYEFLISMMIWNDDRDEYPYEIGNEWFETASAKVSPELVEAVKRFSCCSDRGWINLVGLAYECVSPKDVPTFIEHVRATDALELRLHMIGYYQRGSRRNTPLDVILQAAEGDAESQRQFLKTSFREDADWQEKLRSIFSFDPETMKSAFLDIFSGWYEQVFCELEQQVLPILQRDAAAKQALKSTMTVDRLIETATNGLEYVPEPGLRKVLLIPSFIERPWNNFSEYQDMKIFCYPVTDESLAKDSAIPPARLVRLYKALADERRLRILKMLMKRSYSLQELADEFGVAKTTMHHHLATLRTAGLVLARPDEFRYSLRQNMLSEVGELLNAYLKGK